MKNLRKTLPGPYQVEKFKIEVYTLQKCPTSMFENFRCIVQKLSNTFWWYHQATRHSTVIPLTLYGALVAHDPTQVDL